VLFMAVKVIEQSRRARSVRVKGCELFFFPGELNEAIVEILSPVVVPDDGHVHPHSEVLVVPDRPYDRGYAQAQKDEHDGNHDSV
jgi:hypothetical protein